MPIFGAALTGGMKILIGVLVVLLLSVGGALAYTFHSLGEANKTIGGQDKVIGEIKGKNATLKEEIRVLKEDIALRNKINQDLFEGKRKAEEKLEDAKTTIADLMDVESRKNPSVPKRRPVTTEEVKKTVELNEGWKLYCSSVPTDPACVGVL